MSRRSFLMANGSAYPIPYHTYINWEDRTWADEWYAYPDTGTEAERHKHFYAAIALRVFDGEKASLKEEPYIFFSKMGPLPKGNSTFMFTSKDPMLVFKDEDGYYHIIGKSYTSHQTYPDAIQTLTGDPYLIDGVWYRQCGITITSHSYFDLIAYANHKIKLVTV